MTKEIYDQVRTTFYSREIPDPDPINQMVATTQALNLLYGIGKITKVEAASLYKEFAKYLNVTDSYPQSDVYIELEQ